MTGRAEPGAGARRDDPVRPGRATSDPAASRAIVLAGIAIHVVLRLLATTVRKRFVDEGGLLDAFARGEQVILCFWHGRMVMMPFAYRGRGACIMNSRHRDGELVSQAIRRLGIEVVRGSSTRGWVGGMKGLLAAHRRGRDVIVVPDGPRGPRCQAKGGVLQLARVTGSPIYPVSCGASRSRVLRRSWDWLSIPLPFARVAWVAERPLRVPADADAAAMEALREDLGARLDRATRRADAEVGVPREETEAFLAGVAGPRKS